MSTYQRTKFDEEFGKAVADRLGLPHDQTGIDWSADHFGGQKTVLVTMAVFKAIPLDEFNELRRVAAARAAGAAPKGSGE